jgi:predicted DNA-binding protein (MmcQ/YjbR family)
VAYPSPARRTAALRKLRGICLALPETSERPSHGAPSFFVCGKKCFLMLLDNHHGDRRFAIWCAAPPGNQELLGQADADRFFRPPYVGHRGWLGVMLHGKVDWDEIAGICEDAFCTVAPARLLESIRERPNS